MDEELSFAVVTWTGWGRASFPARDDDLLTATFGFARAIDLLPQVHELEEDFFRSNAHITAPDLQSMGGQAADEFRSAHPEVTEDAVQALAWCYTYDYK
ncbi:hypothetical protein [Microbacterium sp. C7(2022)]|uniref:hypothetical protein n=1 Tax=Microbacterium sp. C7(2022) TaxID=2992759 RepID=UPI00237B54FA|nr:hypothetical protein [Microbacterium sp. C7(2022)]MDE0547408.1 hypothetical protein [Microbacterium sp. C7(2022)]